MEDTGLAFHSRTQTCLPTKKKQDIAQLMLETGEVEAIIYDDEVEQNAEK